MTRLKGLVESVPPVESLLQGGAVVEADPKLLGQLVEKRPKVFPLGRFDWFLPIVKKLAAAEMQKKLSFFSAFGLIYAYGDNNVLQLVA